MAAATAGSLAKRAQKVQLASGILDVFKLDPLIGSAVARLTKVKNLQLPDWLFPF